MTTEPDNIPREALHEIGAWLHQVAPSELLLICPAQSPLHRLAASSTTGEARHLEPREVDLDRLGQRRYDCAVVAQTLEILPRRDAEMLLGRLRDVLTRRFLALIRTEASNWTNTDLIAYGLKRCGRFADGYALYRFNIYDYKDTPDWLNAKYWAHPERWGKHRW